jgi:alpha-glucuronidase
MLILAGLAIFGGSVATGAQIEILFGQNATRIEQTAATILAEGLQDRQIDCRIVSGTAASAGSIVVGTPEMSSTIKSHASALNLDELGPEGFCVQQVSGKSGDAVTLIASAGPKGVLYGCAAVADAIRVGKPIQEIEMREKPALRDRMLWSWGGGTDRKSALFNLERMRQPEKDPWLKDFGHFLARAGFNALGLWPHGEWRPDIGPDCDDVLPAYRSLLRWLKESYGVQTYLFMWYEITQGTPSPIRGYPVCPFDEQVIAHWNQRIGRLMRELPELDGIIMAGAGGDWVRGPWECQCERCRRHSNRELIVEGMNMIGKEWTESGRRIIWKAVTDRPTWVKTEVENFGNFDQELPHNIHIAHKTFYKDFRHVHPFHPLFYLHQDDPADERPYLCEFQIYGEYRGSTQFPCGMVDRWSEIAPMLARKKYRGLMAVCSFKRRDQWDHPLNMVNWYALGRLGWNPNASADEIYRDWATLTFGAEVADEVTALCRMAYEASTKMMFFRGVMTQNHSKLPTIDYELESTLVGPWHHIPKAPDGHWGRGHDVSFYPPEVAEGIRNDPKLLLWAHRPPITTELCDEAIDQNLQAWRLVEEMARRWDRLPHDDWQQVHRDVSEKLHRNCIDAELWYVTLKIYFDYKAGRLTRADLRKRLDDIRARFDPEAGTGLIRETFEPCLQEWERVYQGNRVRRSMESMYHNPDGETFLPGLADD